MCQTPSTERSSLLGNNNNNQKVVHHQLESRLEQHGASSSSSSSSSSTQQKQISGKRWWYVILLGQSIALSLSCANAASSTLENQYQIKIPTFQTGIVYFLLSFHLVHLYWKQRRIKLIQEQNNDDVCALAYTPSCSIAEQTCDVEVQLNMENNSHLQQQSRYTFPFTNLKLQTPYTTYLLLSILDVEANFLANLSFMHTSLSSSMLLTSLSVLSTVLLRQFIFKRTLYDRTRLWGVVLCCVGGCLWLRHESHTNYGFVKLNSNNNTSTEAANNVYTIIYGDLLALSAACLYGLNDVLAEYYIKTNNDRVEYLGMLGFFGCIFSFGIQVPLLEREQVWNLFVIDGLGVGAALLFLCFVILLCYFYMSVMKFLSLYDSTILNLSLQTGPLWAVLLTMLQQTMFVGEESSEWVVSFPPVVFFVSLAMIVMGMILYESNSGKSDTVVGDGENVCSSNVQLVRDSNIT